MGEGSHGREIMETSGGVWEATGCNWEASGTQKVSRKRPGGTQDAPRRHPGCTQDAPRKRPGDQGWPKGVLKGKMCKNNCVLQTRLKTCDHSVSTKRKQGSEFLYKMM